eukprot:CAMPEP_0197585686 /NCGR_PEP_ID=MMETSP1326-20131121/7907_1 /TAXON_ID=1155430 /ORGANISM="Genus nov. species nov., Strain RCC2288" /LENGTH=173 /DNA_ID=CAMNT_0043150227 /DNA_START=1054 /DNA_END=1571 /DNA_ORIENTATION=-
MSSVSGVRDAHSGDHLGILGDDAAVEPSQALGGPDALQHSHEVLPAVLGAAHLQPPPHQVQRVRGGGGHHGGGAAGDEAHRHGPDAQVVPREVLAEGLVRREVYGQVGAHAHQRGWQPAVQPADALLARDGVQRMDQAVVVVHRGLRRQPCADQIQRVRGDARNHPGAPSRGQ